MIDSGGGSFGGRFHWRRFIARPGIFYRERKTLMSQIGDTLLDAGDDRARPAAVGAGQKLKPPGESRVVWTLWLTYGAFYFCRTNISAAVPGLKGCAWPTAGWGCRPTRSAGSWRR